MADTVYHATNYYTGRVQGVGFRASTRQIACEFEVSGYVKNLADGRVMVEAEGDKTEVEAFFDEVADRLSVFIRKVEASAREQNRQFKGFHIQL